MNGDDVREWLACVDLAQEANEDGLKTLLLGLLLWRLLQKAEQPRGTRLLVVGDNKNRTIAFLQTPSTAMYELPVHLLCANFRQLIGDKLNCTIAGQGRPAAPPAANPAPPPAPAAALIKQIARRLKKKGLPKSEEFLPLSWRIFDYSRPDWEAFIKPAIDAFATQGE